MSAITAPIIVPVYVPMPYIHNSDSNLTTGSPFLDGLICITIVVALACFMIYENYKER